MSQELIHTSAPKGIKASQSGFCTVAVDAGLSQVLMRKLEALSGYVYCYELSDPEAERNPANFAHTAIDTGSGRRSVLSRVAFCGADYSGRTNKIAHHFLLSAQEQLAAGPAAMMLALREAGLFHTEWTEAPRQLHQRDLRQLQPRTTDNGAWARYGDAGWAGVLARAFGANRKIPSYVVFRPGLDLLPLFVESLAVLPPELRWQVHFATYYSTMPPGCNYHWRGVVAGSPAAKEMGRFPNATVIDLTQPLGTPPEDAFTQAARQGRVVQVRTRASRREPPVPSEQAGEARKQRPVETYALAEDPEPAAQAAGRPTAQQVGPKPLLDELGAGPAVQDDPAANKRSWLVPVLAAAVVLLVVTNVAVIVLWRGDGNGGRQDGAGGQVAAAPTAGPLHNPPNATTQPRDASTQPASAPATGADAHMNSGAGAERGSGSGSSATTAPANGQGAKAGETEESQGAAETTSGGDESAPLSDNEAPADERRTADDKPHQDTVLPLKETPRTAIQGRELKPQIVEPSSSEPDVLRFEVEEADSVVQLTVPKAAWARGETSDSVSKRVEYAQGAVRLYPLNCTLLRRGDGSNGLTVEYTNDSKKDSVKPIVRYLVLEMVEGATAGQPSTVYRCVLDPKAKTEQTIRVTPGKDDRYPELLGDVRLQSYPWPRRLRPAQDEEVLKDWREKGECSWKLRMSGKPALAVDMKEVPSEPGDNKADINDVMLSVKFLKARTLNSRLDELRDKRRNIQAKQAELDGYRKADKENTGKIETTQKDLRELQKAYDELRTKVRDKLEQLGGGLEALSVSVQDEWGVERVHVSFEVETPELLKPEGE